MAYDLKSEGDVKEYIKNLGIEYRFGCYSEKKPDGNITQPHVFLFSIISQSIPNWSYFFLVCHLLADFLEAIKKDYEKAGKVYRTNCDDYKYGKSCLKYATYNFLGKGSKKSDFKLAYDYFEKGCNLDEPDSCLHQGLLLISKNEQVELKQDVIKVGVYLTVLMVFYLVILLLHFLSIIGGNRYFD